MKVLKSALIVCAVATMASAACASDLNFGSYARSIAMGGAGLALTDDPSTSSVINPAAGAASGAKFQFLFPSLDFNTRGTSLSELRSKTSEVSDGDSDSALKLAQDFGKQPTNLGISFVTGFAGTLGVTAEGEAQGIITPGANFSQWVNAGLPTNLADLSAAVTSGAINDPAFVAAITAAAGSSALGSRALAPGDLTDVANLFTAGTDVQAKMLYAVPAVNYGTGFNTSGGKLWVGTRARWLNSETHTWTIQQKAGITNDIELEAVEDLTKETDDTGFGADLGFVYQPHDSITQFGMVINNFVDPSLKGIETPMMLSVGISSQPRTRFRYAIDLVNINKAYNEGTQLRMGAEWIIASKLVLRGGYSGDEFTYGFGIAGLNFAFAGESPNVISRTLRF